MKLFYPEIFDEFVCTGSQCSDNCCMTDWDIEIDEDTYGFYKKLDNDIGRKFVNSVTEDEGVKYLVHCDGKCLCSTKRGFALFSLLTVRKTSQTYAANTRDFMSGLEITRRQAWDLPAKKL
ncbi:hypothetical protein DW964_08175 [Ruminococcus sp. AM47-2BH]|nr:hypothetical protein DW964_08175 [Ruminococcus sp. AM47-2BH]